MAENIPIRDDSSYSVRRGWSLERFLRVSWGAIFAGFVVAFATMVLLLLLGGAIGLSVLNVASPGDAEAWSWGAGIWYILSTIIALFVGGMVAGRLAGVPRSVDSMLHGAATWGLIIVASLLLTGTALGQLFGAATGMAQTDAGQQGMQQATSQQGGSAAEQIRQQARQYVQSPDQQFNQTLDQFIAGLQRGEPVNEDLLVQELTARGNMSESEARMQVDRWVSLYEGEGSSEMMAATQEATDTAAGLAWATFLATLLGALAAMGGGWLGTPEDVSSLTESHHRHGYDRTHGHNPPPSTGTTPPTGV